jgi:Tol biopolymer transport system component
MTTSAVQRAQRAVRLTHRTSAIVLLIVVATAFAVQADDAASDAERHGDHRFVVDSNPYVLGQAMDWLDRRHVVWHDPVIRDEDGDGQVQIHSSTLDGAEKVCLTCGLPGPNQVPVVQPHGRWILFHSWSGHTVTAGGPGFGGLGSDIWVMTRDGAQQTNLTHDTELHDNFHAYWSPDGKYIVWTSLSWNSGEGGNGRSDVRVARFDPQGPNGPRLTDEHVVRPGNGHWYETQWWAPDGSGFLYTETVDTAINPELFFCRLPNPAAGMCHPVRLTRDPAWDEQAIFTPDMKRILFMSSRNLPGAQNDWSRIASFLELPAEYDYELILFVFTDGYLQPILQQATDLYEITLRWNQTHARFKGGRVRRLTQSGEDGWVIPEFAWDPSGRRLLWTQNKFSAGRRLDQGCVMRQIRAGIISQLAGVDHIGQIPFNIVPQIRDQAVALLGDPKSYVFQGTGCGGDQPDQQPSYAQETQIGHYAE